MRLLIFGAGGQIGAHLVTASQNHGHQVLGTWYRRPLSDCVPVDLCDEETVFDVMKDFEPDIAVIAAGMSQVDFAERHADECMRLAQKGTQSVAEAARSIDARIVLITSNHVFGECQHPTREEQPAKPINVYGRAQVAAEKVVRGLLPRSHLIIRTSIVYGDHELPRNLALHTIRRLSEGQSLESASDRYIQPTYAPDLAEACCACFEQSVVGTVHIAGGERVVESSFTKHIAFLFGFDSDAVIPVPADSLGEDAPRPKSPWLDRSRIKQMLGTRVIRSISDGLRAIRDQHFTRLRHAA